MDPLLAVIEHRLFTLVINLAPQCGTRIDLNRWVADALRERTSLVVLTSSSK